MHPLLFEIPFLGGIRIYSYGVLIALAFLAGIFWSGREARQTDMDPNRVMDLCFYIILAALVGSRVLYVLVEWERYLSKPLDIFKIWEGGLVFYGGFLAALVTVFVFVRQHQIPFLKMADVLVPAVPLAHSIGRLGCLMAGCCHGRPYPDSFFAITFSNPLSLAPQGIPLFPSQPLESVVNFCIFLVLIAIRRRKNFEGQVFFSYLMIYSVARSVLEIYRGDVVRGFLIPDLLSTSQFISACLALFALAGYVFFRRQKRQNLL